MKRQTLALLIGVITLVAGVVAAAPAQRQERRQELQPEWLRGTHVGEYTLSGPYRHENLTLFLIHGPGGSAGGQLLTLEEAMARRVVIVHETEEVNELAVRNVSRRQEVFIQSGDIVKGGQQDRMLSVDLIVPARSGRIPIDAFCVEHGRWEGRGGEPVAAFSGSEQMVATKELKMAARQARSQEEVWQRVDEAQAKLSASTNVSVQSPDSESSLQLSLENAKVKAQAGRYIRALSKIVEGKSDVIGYAFAVNGRVSSADVYASGALFRKLWPKLLKASAVEALAEMPSYDKTAVASVSADTLRELFADAEQGSEETQEVTKRTHMLKREGERGIFFETRDMAHNGAWVHRNYLAK